MSHSLLDYRFAWRCLLPAELIANAGVQLRLWGFAEEEEEFWRDWFGQQSRHMKVERGEGGQVQLVDAQRCEKLEQPSPAELARADLVVVLADRAQSRKWHHLLSEAFPKVREFALLPRGNPRVVVPLGQRRHTLAGLDLHRPGRWLARAGIGVARGLAAIGQLSLLRGRVLLIAERKLGAVPTCAAQAGPAKTAYSQPSHEFALYLGTPGDNRKTVMLPLGLCPPTLILKTGTTSRARASLYNEAMTLAALAGTPLAGQVPRLLGQQTCADTLTLQQEFRPRRRVAKARQETAVVDFLSQLAGLSARPVALGELLAALPTQLRNLENGRTHARLNAELPAALLGGSALAVRYRHNEAAASAYLALRARLGSLDAQGEIAWVQRTHGDFAPWNCAWSDDGLFVYDWEDSRDSGLALSDAFYYATAPALFLRRKPRAAATLAAALALAKRVAVASPTSLNVHIQLALWLLEQAGKAAFYDKLLIELSQSWK